jgi:hypothetical protein
MMLQHMLQVNKGQKEGDGSPYSAGIVIVVVIFFNPHQNRQRRSEYLQTAQQRTEAGSSITTNRLLTILSRAFSRFLKRYSATPFMSSSSVSTPLQCLEPVPSDIEISQHILPKNIAEIAERCGLFPNEYDLYGTTKAKVSLNVRDRLSSQQNGNYVVVTGINPTRE